MSDSDSLRFVILEDNLDRRAAMLERLADRFPQYAIAFFSTAAECIDCLNRRLNATLAISLDHDLELIPAGGERFLDPGTGRQVAEFLAAQTPSCPVIVHSTNTAASEAMVAILEDAGWPVQRVVPYGDREWISESWFPTLRKALSEWTRSCAAAEVGVR